MPRKETLISDVYLKSQNQFNPPSNSKTTTLTGELHLPAIVFVKPSLPSYHVDADFLCYEPTPENTDG